MIEDIDKTGMRCLITASQLEAQIDLCEAELLLLLQFYVNLGMELGFLIPEDWTYLQANNYAPTEEMVRGFLNRIDTGNV